MNTVIKEDIAAVLSADYIDWERFRHKKVLITGAYGMLSSYLVYTLMALNEREPSFDVTLYALGRSRDKMMKRFGCYEGDPHFVPVYESASSFSGNGMTYDFIVHAASPTNPRSYQSDPETVIGANVIATDRLLKMAEERGCDCFLYISSGEVYGRLEKDVILEEDGGVLNANTRRSVYGMSKTLGELLVVSAAEKGRVHGRIVRPSHTYGPTMDPATDGRVFGDFVGNAIRGEDIVMTSDGMASRAFTYLTDAVLGYFAVMTKGTDGEAYNVTNNKGICRIRDLAQIMTRISPYEIKAVCGTPDRDYIENANRKASIRSTEKLEALGWHACVMPEEGFARTVKALML